MDIRGLYYRARLTHALPLPQLWILVSLVDFANGECPPSSWTMIDELRTLFSSGNGTFLSSSNGSIYLTKLLRFLPHSGVCFIFYSHRAMARPRSAKREHPMRQNKNRTSQYDNGYWCVEGSTLKNVEIEMKWALPRPELKRPLPRVATQQRNELTAESAPIII